MQVETVVVTIETVTGGFTIKCKGPNGEDAAVASTAGKAATTASKLVKKHLAR